MKTSLLYIKILSLDIFSVQLALAHVLNTATGSNVTGGGGETGGTPQRKRNRRDVETWPQQQQQKIPSTNPNKHLFSFKTTYIQNKDERQKNEHPSENKTTSSIYNAFGHSKNMPKTFVNCYRYYYTYIFCFL